MVEAHFFKPGGSEGVSVSFDALILRFPASNEWPAAAWEFIAGTSTTKYPTASIEEISGLAERFNVSIIDGDGTYHGPFSVQSVMCGYPNYSFCFLFYLDPDGMWSGHTVTKSFGRIVIAPHRTDPA